MPSTWPVLCYAGGALGVTFAGDLFSLYIFWEILAIASVFLILARRTPTSAAAAFRYFMWHFFGGLCLLAGIILYVTQRGTAEFAYIGLTDRASIFIFIGFCLNAAVFPLHAWLPDAYPRATVSGAVFMSALTTKSAVYILARTFPGTETLIWAGAFMTCFPIFYAVIVNDMRRVLAYSLINQVGFMVCGIGIGTQLAINGVVAHAFCHIIYKALLVHVHRGRAAHDRQDPGHGSGRALQNHALYGGLLHDRGRLHFGVSAVQRLRQQIHDGDRRRRSST